MRAKQSSNVIVLRNWEGGVLFLDECINQVDGALISRACETVTAVGQYHLARRGASAA